MITHAYISGTLGQAVIVDSEQTLLLHANGDENFVEPRRNDLSFFFSSSREILDLIDARNQPVSRSDVSTALEDETIRHEALGNFLTAMDQRFRDATRLKAIGKVETAFNNESVFKFVAGRVSTNAPQQGLDVQSAIVLAKQRNATITAELLENSVGAGNLEFAIETAFGDANLDSDVEIRLRNELMDDPRMADIALAYAKGDQSFLKNLVFELVNASIERKKVLTKLANTLLNILDEPNIDIETQDQKVVAALELSVARSEAEDRITKLINNWHRDDNTTQGKASIDISEILEKIKGQIDWFLRDLKLGHEGRAYNTLFDLIAMQLRESKPDHLVKTLSDIAKRAFDLNFAQFAFDIVNYAKLLHVADAALYCTEAEMMRKSGNLLQALETYQSTANDFPNNEVTRNGLAETLRQLGRLDEALETYQSTANDFPNNEVTLCGLAETLRQLGRLDEALETYQSTANDFPNNEVTLCGLAETMRELGKPINALEIYQTTTTEFPNDVVARCGLAETMRELGNPIDALEIYQTTTTEFPNNVVARNGLAETMRELGKPNEALVIYQTTTNEFPNNVVARCGLAETMRELGNPIDALEIYQTTTNEFPNDVVARNGLAETMRELGNPIDALEIYQTTTNEFPNDVVARCGLAETMRELGKPNEALVIYQMTTTEFPNNVVARCGLAESMRELGNPIDALEIYQTTTNEFPNNVVARCGLAETMRELGNPIDALEIYQTTTTEFPNDVVARCGLAETMRELGNPIDALEIYQTTTTEFPNDVVARCGLASTYLQLGNYNAVRDTLAFSKAPATKSEWIAEHILAMNELRHGNIDEAILRLENGVVRDPIAESRRYFVTALAAAKLQKGLANDVIRLLDEEASSNTGRQARNILTLKAHAYALNDNKEKAEQSIKDAENIVPFSEFSAKRLKKSLETRFKLFGNFSHDAINDTTELLDQRILEDEISLLLAA